MTTAMSVHMHADNHVIVGYNSGWNYAEDDGGVDSVMLEVGAAKGLAVVI